MRRVSRILSSKLDLKLNYYPRRARTILRSKVNIYSTIIRRVYGDYTITSFLGNFGACANIRYQATSSLLLSAVLSLSLVTQAAPTCYMLNFFTMQHYKNGSGLGTKLVIVSIIHLI